MRKADLREVALQLNCIHEEWIARQSWSDFICDEKRVIRDQEMKGCKKDENKEVDLETLNRCIFKNARFIQDCAT